jgi:hypothetical protein
MGESNTHMYYSFLFSILIVVVMKNANWAFSSFDQSESFQIISCFSAVQCGVGTLPVIQ